MDKFIYYIGLMIVIISSVSTLCWIYWKLLDWIFKTVKYTMEIINWVRWRKEFEKWLNEKTKTK